MPISADARALVVDAGTALAQPGSSPVVATDPDRPTRERTDYEGELKVAQAAVRSREAVRAIKILKKLEKIKPRDPRLHRNLGISHALLGETANAAKHYQKYIELKPAASDADAVRAILANAGT